MNINVSSVTSHFPNPQDGFTTTTSSLVSSGATTVGLTSTGDYSNGDIVALIIDPADADKKQVFVGTINTATSQVTGVIWVGGTNQSHSNGATVVDYYDAAHIKMMTKGLLVAHNQDGTIKSGAVTYVAPRVGTVADAATITPTGDSSDMYTVTALAQAATIAAPSGTPVNGQKLILRFKDNGTGRALNWNAIYRAIGVTLPTTTTASKTHYVGLIYNSADTKWDAVAVVEQA